MSIPDPKNHREYELISASTTCSPPIMIGGFGDLNSLHWQVYEEKSTTLAAIEIDMDIPPPGRRALICSIAPN